MFVDLFEMPRTARAVAKRQERRRSRVRFPPVSIITKDEEDLGQTMKIRKIEPISLLDYPDEIASVIFVEGCNLHCPYCFNWRLLEPDTDYIGQSNLIESLEKHQLFIDAAVITGGEPTLQSDLSDALTQIKGLGLLTKVDTNGTNPDMIVRILSVVDYIAMDVKSDFSGYSICGADDEMFKDIQKSIKSIMESGKDYEFRCTAVYPFLNEKNIYNIGKMVEGAKLFIFQKARLENVLNPQFPMKAIENLKFYQDILSSYVQEVRIR